MNGPEHYAEAERLLSAASFITHPGGPPVDAAASAHSAAAAQVHATLALTAAFALRDDSREWSAWCKVASKPVDGGQ